MWDRSSSRRPIASFTIPPHPPAPVAEAYAEYDRVANQWAALIGEISDAEEAGRKAKSDAKAAVTAAAVAGKQSKVSIVGVEEEHLGRVAELRERAGAIALAVDEAGNSLVQAIARNQEPWLANLADAEADAAKRVAAALKATRQALADLTPARAAVGWLQAFDAAQARVGRQPQFAGGRLHVDTTHVRRETTTDPKTLVDVIATTLEQPKPPTSRRPRVAVR